MCPLSSVIATLQFLQVTTALFVLMIALALTSDGRICSLTTSPLRDPQRRRLEFVAHLFFSEFFGREISDAFNRHGVILERQPELSTTVFVVGVFHVGGDGAVGDVHRVDVINVGLSEASGAGVRKSGVSCDSLSTRPRDNT
jgi:hypothetical protein